MKPFLILQLRPLDLASDNEFEAILDYGELKDRDVHRVRMDQVGIPEIDLDQYSGIILGGGPSNVSDKRSEKKIYQKRFEQDLEVILNEIFEKDFPFLGICYGIGALVDHQGGEVSKENYSENVEAVQIELTEAGKIDELLSGVQDKFMAYVGHKEACQKLPENATLLAKSKTCPFQMLRFQNNIYGIQFHTELDDEGIQLRINIYKNYGYFSPKNAALLIENSKKYNVTQPSKILHNFVKKYGRI